MRLVGQRFELRAIEAELMVHVEHTGRRDDEMGVQLKLPRTLQQPYAVNRAGRAGDADDQACHAQPAKACCSSPLWYISIMMSEPPMNSPFTYSCGMVGQLA